MRPTRRGYAALAVVVVTLVVAATTGSEGRALNAVAGPVLVAVGAGAVQVYRAGEPTIERTRPRSGFPGESRPVELSVDGSGVATTTDEVGEGLAGAATVSRTLPTTFTYEVTYEERGLHSLGPASVRGRDALGLVETQYVVGDTTQVLVYPQVYAVGDTGSVLGRSGPASNERTEFEQVREYVPGDSLRDVHWKASAKHTELLVTEYGDPTNDEAVAIAGASAAGHADEMATAVATLFVAAIREGMEVSLAVPGGTLGLGHGETQEQRGLELLARTGTGRIPDDEWDDADLRVNADDSGVTVTVGEQVHALDDLTAGRANPLLTEVDV